MLQSANLDFWEIAQGVATTTATFGLVGGILIGMLLINIASRKNFTAILKKPGDIPESFKIGFVKDIENQPKLGRETNPHLHVGICGEHGGDPDTIEFLNSVGIDYVSCSPFRVPIARLAAAQAKIKQSK